tara:strand:- start:434 stop:988 length:555 start_codon:yes stop_codon:yes gene_type:complete
MVWKYGDVQLKAGRSWTDKNGTKHPSNWMIWSNDAKKGFGLTWEDDVDTSYDDRFYSSKGVELKLDDVKEVDKDGKAIIDTRTGQQMITRGLKYKWIEQTKSTANGLLTVSDWYVTRKSETDTAIPSDISKYREDVRTATKTIEDKINACTKLADFMKLFDAPVDKDGNPTDKAPIYNFPDEVI